MVPVFNVRADFHQAKLEFKPHLLLLRLDP